MFISRSEAFKFAVGDVITLPCEVTQSGNFSLRSIAYEENHLHKAITLFSRIMMLFVMLTLFFVYLPPHHHHPSRLVCLGVEARHCDPYCGSS